MNQRYESLAITGDEVRIDWRPGTRVITDVDSLVRLVNDVMASASLPIRVTFTGDLDPGLGERDTADPDPGDPREAAELTRRAKLAEDPRYYATDEHDRDDLPWPVPATAWFWQTGDRWMAVVADWHEDWWEGCDPHDPVAAPHDPVAAPEPWRRPIQDVPTSGTLVYREADGRIVQARLGSRP